MKIHINFIEFNENGATKIINKSIKTASHFVFLVVILFWKKILDKYHELLK